MALTLPATVARLSRQIPDAELLIGQTLAQVSETIATVARAQVEVEGAPKVATQAALSRLQNSAAKLVAAQADMLRAHGELTSIGREMMGPEEPFGCPKEAFTTGEVSTEKRAA